MIRTGLSPNLMTQDMVKACIYLLPWNWKKWFERIWVPEVERKLQLLFPEKEAILFDSGRTSLSLLLEAMKIGPGDEVIIQAYTCAVVPLAIMQRGATPVFADIDEQTLTMTVETIQHMLTVKTKAVVVQHTFGAYAPAKDIAALCKGHGIYMIEDCAHVLDRTLPMEGDATILSFGSDKPLSSIRGGAVLVSRGEMAEQLRMKQQTLPNFSKRQVFIFLLHPLLFGICLPIYDFFNLGKVLLYIAKRCGLLPLVLSPSEKAGQSDQNFFYKMPDVLAAFLVQQLEHLEEKNLWRKKLFEMFQGVCSSQRIPLQQFPRGGIPLRCTLLSEHRDALVTHFKKMGISMGDWYTTVIAPKDIDPKIFGYHSGSCPVAERMAGYSANLPLDLRVTLKDAHHICDAIRSFVS